MNPAITNAGRIEITQMDLVIMNWTQMQGNRTANQGSGFQAPMFPARFSIAGWSTSGPGHHILFTITDEFQGDRPLTLYNPEQSELWFDMRPGSKVSISQPQSGTLSGIYIDWTLQIFM